MPLFRPPPHDEATQDTAVTPGQPLSADDLLSPEEIADRRRRRRWLLGLPFLGLAALGIAFGARPALHATKAWQARRTAAAAERLIAGEHWIEAKGKVQDALQIWQREPAALRAAALLLGRTGNPREATGLWHRVAAERPLARDEEREYAQVLLANHDLASAEGHLRKAWPSSEEGTPKDWELGMQLALGHRDLPVAIALARRLLAARTTSARQRLAPALVLTSASDRDTQATGWGEILDLATGKVTPESLDALLVLAQRVSSPSDSPTPPIPASATWPTVTELIDKVEAHPLARIQHHLLMVDLRIAQNPMGRTEQIQAAIDRFAATADDAELGVLASWLYGKTEFLRVLEVLPAPRVANDATLIYRRLDALAALDRWNEIQKAIQSQKGVIDPMLEQMYLARCATQLNEPQVRDARWEAALDTAGTKPEKLLQLGDYAQKTGNLSMAIRAFEAAVQATPEAREPYESLLRALEASGNTRKLRETLTTVLKHWPQDAAVRNDAAYFDALLGENLRSSLDAARGLVRADPTSLPHRVTLALAELRGGNSLAALDAFTAIDTSHIVMQPRQRAVLAAVYWATSYTHEAREAVRTLPLDQLLPEERSLVQPIIDATNAGKSTVGN